MDNLTYVIRGMERIANDPDKDFFVSVGLGELQKLANAAIYFLKNQEPIQPYYSGGYHPDIYCGNCNNPGLNKRMRFCPYCGRMVKWNE